MRWAGPAPGTEAVSALITDSVSGAAARRVARANAVGDAAARNSETRSHGGIALAGSGTSSTHGTARAASGRRFQSRARTPDISTQSPARAATRSAQSESE